MKSGRVAPSTSALAALTSLVLLIPTPVLCAPHEALRQHEQQCRCISLPKDESSKASVIQLSVTSQNNHRVSGEACPQFAPLIQNWRDSDESNTQDLASVLVEGGENGTHSGLLQFVSPLPDGVLEEIEQGEDAEFPETLGMEGGAVDRALHSGAVVCRAVDFEQAHSVLESQRVKGLCRVMLFVFVLACVAEIFGRVGGRLYRRFFSSRHPAAIRLHSEKPLWMSSSTFSDLKMALDEDDESYRSGVL